ncbi:MSF1 protein [Rhizoctonia solani]|nr:MSF1 protein [Rhizoctonia solani]
MLFNLLGTLAALPRWLVWSIFTVATSRLLLSLKGIQSAKEWDNANRIARRDIEMEPRDGVKFIYAEHEDDECPNRHCMSGHLKTTTLADGRRLEDFAAQTCASDDVGAGLKVASIPTRPLQPHHHMVNLFSQSHTYDDNWATVTLAFFLRYPNPFSAHVLSCDVIDRSFTPEGNLRTTRLILKRGNLPKWFPSGVVARSESWIVEESEVDTIGHRVNCTTRNLEHTKALRVIEQVTLRPLEDGRTLQVTEARFQSRFGWGLTKRIESYASTKFRSNIEKSRQGIFLVLNLLRESRMQLQPLGGPISPTGTIFDTYVSRLQDPHRDQAPVPDSSIPSDSQSAADKPTAWKRWRSRFWSRSL